MFRRQLALLWSRKEMIVSNKAILVNFALPVLMVLLYQFMFKGQKGANELIFFMLTPMIPSFLGYTLPTLVGEEAEKNNQRSLRLAGVKAWEYVLASLVIPFLATILYLFILPVYLQIDFAEIGWHYFVLAILTTLTILALYMIVSLMADTQARASIIAMPLMMLSFLLPMLALTDDGIANIVRFTYMGAFSVYSKEMLDYQWTDMSFVFLLIWLVAAIVALLWVTKKKQVIR